MNAKLPLRTIDLARAAGADVPDLGARELRVAAARRKSVPVVHLVRMAADVAAHARRHAGIDPRGARPRPGSRRRR